MSIGELEMRNVVSLHCDSERVSHRFAQILSLQATVLYTSSLTVKKICVICGKIKHSTLIINKNEKGNNSESNQFRHHRPHCRPLLLLCAELQVIAFEHELHESNESICSMAISCHSCRHSHSSPEGISGRPPLQSRPRLSRCRDSRPS